MTMAQRRLDWLGQGLYGNYMGGPMRAFLSGLMLLSSLILLAACFNLGSLFALARQTVPAKC